MTIRFAPLVLSLYAVISLIVWVTAEASLGDPPRAGRDQVIDIRTNTYQQLSTMNQEREKESQQSMWQAGERLARVLDSDASFREIGALAQGEASLLGESVIQQALAPYGTSRLKLNFNTQDGFEGSEFDFLYPLYETPDHVTLTQVGIRHLNKRTMANLGIGQRFWPRPDMMVGYNTFFDYDITRGHSRLGVGIEYARDYLRLSSNGYFRLSDWKTSYDLQDYQERVANGFDLRAEGWLPHYPQLGATLGYSRYYGDAVGVFGPDELQRDPKILSVGLNITPVPLLGFSVEQALNLTGGENETRLGLEMRYQFGVPLTLQLDPQRVGIQRTLTAMRYDLIDRNNNIILEYKQDRLFTLPSNYRLSGVEGDIITVDLPISSKYIVSGVIWSGSRYFSSGGDIAYQNGRYQFTLPEWSELGDNRYILEGRAVDVEGNLSAPFSVTVEVTALAVKISLSGDVKGEEGEMVPLGLNARTFDGIAEVDWVAPAFIAAGGQFIQKEALAADSHSLNYYALLPSFRSGESNQYQIDVSVKDNAGNVSNSVSAHIRVEPRSLRLTLPARVDGVEGTRILLPLTVQSKAPISHYTWQANAFLAQGGQIIEQGEQLWLVLPAWSAAAANQYPLTLTAVDSEGHTAVPVSTTVIVASASVSLTVETALSGVSGSVVFLTPSLSGDVPLAHMTLQGEAFFAQGGTVTPQPDGRYAVKLPLWQKGRENRYTLEATAYDAHGRPSNRVSIALSVLPVRIELVAPERVEGLELSRVAFMLDAQSDDHAPLSIEFDAPAFERAGGTIQGSLPNYHLQMPEWQAGLDNRYTITARAQDTLGNRSEPQAISVTVAQAPVMLRVAESNINGYAGESVSLPIEVSGLYGIASYNVEADALALAGGNVAAEGDELRFFLPTFQVGKDNRYSVTVQAVDKKGTLSNALQLSVLITTPLPGDVSRQCSVIGGGLGYRDAVKKEMVDYQVATDYLSLKALVDKGTEYIFIPNDVEIDIPLVSNALVIKSGTTIFGERGIDGSEGGTLNVAYVDEEEYKFPVIMMESNTRISGLRYRGPYSGTTTNNNTIGIQTVPGSHNIEVDNMELSGWPWAAVSVKQSDNVRVHSSYIHDNIKLNWGYGVVTQNGDAKADILCNVFDSNRHAIAGQGQRGEGYTARHNLVLNGGGKGAYHQFDMHGYGPANIAGDYMAISYNWFDYGREGTSNRTSIMVRGQPESGPIIVEDNWFSQGWQVGKQYAVEGQYGLWVPTVSEIQANNQFNVNFRYLDKMNEICTIDWLSYSQTVNCRGVSGYLSP